MPTTTTSQTRKPATIHISGARMHNLKNVEVTLPRNQLIVVTGVSGSGKSSLVFDTLYAEGHRRYVESLSAYARQFLARLPKPDVDFIRGISPAIAIEQRVISSNPRSTVGSITEIYDYLRLLFARIGKTYSPISGREVASDNVTDVVDYIYDREEGAKILLFCSFPENDRPLIKELEISIQKGFSRVWHKEQVIEIEDLLGFGDSLVNVKREDIMLLVDRFALEKTSDEFRHRIADSVQTALAEGAGVCYVRADDGPAVQFSDRFEADGIMFERPTEAFFNFNNPFGACPNCEGFGRVMGFDEDLIIPDRTRSVMDGTVQPWTGPTHSVWLHKFVDTIEELGLLYPLRSPYYRLTDEQREMLWYGDPKHEIQGIYDFFNDLQEQAFKVQNRIMISRYRGYSTCPECRGSRLRKEVTYVKVGGLTIDKLLAMPIDQLYTTFDTLEIDDSRRKVADLIFREIRSRLEYLLDVGLGYLALNRKASTLSGGETQRINLATSLGSSLVGSMYILDEPSIGLHPRDTMRLIKVLKRLRDLGNTVVVVEHDEGIMRQADFLVDMGPLAGEHGGEVVAKGTVSEVEQNPDSLTGRYLSGKESVPIRTELRQPTHFLIIREAAENNLKGIDVEIPLHCFVAMAGVSGSGKTTLVKQILYPAMRQTMALSIPEKPGLHRALEGEYDTIDQIELIDQGALSVTSRSNPATYTGSYDAIRTLFANTSEAQTRRLKASDFSYNTPGGRCETCEGEGHLTIPMQFLPDVKLLCETCNGQRFKQVVLEVEYRGKNIFQVLNMTVTEALVFFVSETRITKRLAPLENVGLGYLRLGQSTNTLSGGEAQRLKLASFLQVKDGKHTMFIFDEPTTGLHAHDVRRLVDVFHQLIDQGNSILVIEHNLDLLRAADWIIELGPEGGVDGGELVFSGTPKALSEHPLSYTGKCMREEQNV